MIFLIAAGVLFVVGGLGLAYWIGWRDRYAEPLVGGLLGGCVVLIALVLLAVATMPSSSVPDGCYAIGSTTSSGVGVGIGPKGGVTVVPITTSGKTYTPIACPA